MRAAQVDMLRGEVQRLLTAATHRVTQEQVRLASRDLDEAIAWLGQDDFDARWPLHRVVDLIINLATWRLRMVRDALQKHGPDAAQLG